MGWLKESGAARRRAPFGGRRGTPGAAAASWIRASRHKRARGPAHPAWAAPGPAPVASQPAVRRNAGCVKGTGYQEVEE